MKNRNNILPIIIIALLVVFEMLTVLQIWQIDVVSLNVLLLLLGIVILFDLLLLKLLLSGKKRGKKLWCRTLGYILSAFVIALFFFLNQGISKIQETMDKVTQTIPVSAVVELYVLKENSADVLEDTAEYYIAVTESVDQENMKVALEAMENSLGKSVRSISYDNIFAMINALYEKKVDALLINSAYVDIIVEQENYTDFSQRVKCIWQYDVQQIIREERVEEVTGTVEAGGEEYAPFVVYISGSDTRSKKLKTSRSDVNILAVVNPQTEQILLINTPRDYYIPNPAGKGELDKLTHCGIYGVDCSVQALSDLYDEEILYYGQINFTGFETLIDAIGGVDVYSEVAFTTFRGNYNIKQGMNHLNGEQALGFAHDRYSLEGGDNARGKNQMRVIKAIIDQISAGNIIANYSEIMDSLQGMFLTNISAAKISSLIKVQFSEMVHWDVKSYAVTGTGDSAKTYSVPGMNAYVMQPNYESVSYAQTLIDRVMSGEILTDEDINKN